MEESAGDNTPEEAELTLEQAYDSFRLQKKSKKEGSNSDEDDAFTVSFTSFSMILLAFFVYLNSLATPNDERRQQVIGSLAQHFVRQASIGIEAEKPSGELPAIPIPELLQGFPRLTFATKHADLADTAEQANFAVDRIGEQFTITLPGEELFASGDDRIRAEIIPSLRQIAALVKQKGLFVEIEGHTDDQAINTVRFPSNWSLSIARAVSVLRLFLDAGIPEGQIIASGRSSSAPVASNETEEGRAKNRRVVLVVSERDPLAASGAST